MEGYETPSSDFPYVVRPATERDIVELGGFNASNAWFSRVPTDDRLAYFRQPDKYVVLVAANLGQVVGFVLCKLDHPIGDIYEFENSERSDHQENTAANDGKAATSIRLIGMDVCNCINDEGWEREAATMLVNSGVRMGLEKACWVTVYSTPELELFFEILVFEKIGPDPWRGVVNMMLLPKMDNY